LANICRLEKDTPNMPAPKIVVIMPAYNASKTLERTFREIPRDIVQECIVVDDPKKIPDLVQPIVEGRADCVLGSRMFPPMHHAYSEVATAAPSQPSGS
jgi:hypothetical protein